MLLALCRETCLIKTQLKPLLSNLLILGISSSFPCTRRIPCQDLRVHCSIAPGEPQQKNWRENLAAETASVSLPTTLFQTRPSVQPFFSILLFMFYFLGILNEGCPGPENAPNETSKCFNVSKWNAVSCLTLSYLFNTLHQKKCYQNWLSSSRSTHSQAVIK